MGRPSLIEFHIPSGERICLIFQSKAVPLLEQEIHGDEIWPNRCPDDGTLFLEGYPEDYLNETICLDPPNDSCMFALTPDLMQCLLSAKWCSFGEVTEAEEGGGSGAGFIFDGKSFQHDPSLGISNERSVVQRIMGADVGIVVLINRPEQYAVRKYYDEENPPPAKVKKGEAAKQEKSGEADVNMMDEESDAVESPEPADALAGCMKTLRLRGE